MIQHVCKNCGQSFTRYTTVTTLCPKCQYNKYAKPKKPIKRMGKVAHKWIKVRREFLDNQVKFNGKYRCNMCGKLIANPDVDHVKNRGSHPDLRFEHSNLQILCRSCHIKKTSASW